LRWFNWWQGALCALAALIFNVLILPRIGGKSLYRGEDVKRGYPIGIVLYPISVLLLILCMPHHLYVAAAGWGIMAWGDGFASIFGRKFGKTKIPWNENRSWAGSAAFLVFGAAAAIFFTAWVWREPSEPRIWSVILIPFLGAFLATIVETIPTGVNDNLTVPLSAGFFMLGLYQIDPSLLSSKQDQLIHNFIWGASINLALAGISYALKMVSISGFISGFLIGTTLYTFGGYQGFLVLLAFFILGSGCTKFGYAYKKSLGVAQEKGGARGWKNATANCSVGTFLAILGILSAQPLSSIFFAGMFAAFATAAADTVSSEIGQVLGKHPILITTLRPVPVGTEGAVSLEGTFAGIVASMIVASLGIVFHMFGWIAAGFVVVGAFVGTTVESYLGATLEQMKIIDNEIINFMNTLVGAAATMILLRIFASLW